MSETDFDYIEFGELFEHRFLKQDYNENRTLDQTLENGWKIFSSPPEGELTKIKGEHIEKYHGRVGR